MGARSKVRPDSLPAKPGSKGHEIPHWLSEVDLFKDVDPEELAHFFKRVELRTYPAGSIIYSPEDSSTERLYILAKGRVERYRLTTGGKRLLTRQIRPRQVFGVMGLLGRTMQGNFAEATEDTAAYLITREDVLALLKRQPDFALRVLENVGKRVRMLEERLVDAFYSPAMTRLARFVLDNADPQSEVLSDVTHEQIANTIGAVRQTVTEMLTVLKKQGLIRTERRLIRIVNRHGLETITEGQSPSLEE